MGSALNNVARKLLGVTIRLLAGLWAASWRVEQEKWPVEGACIAAFWHENIFPMTMLHRNMGMVAVVSLSNDGELLAEIARDLGYDLIRGSSSRGGLGVLREGLRALREGKRLGIALDGPRGPAQKAQPGAEALARQRNVPIVFGFIETTGIRLNSWDRFLIPWPFARLRLHYQVWTPTDGALEDWLFLHT